MLVSLDFFKSIVDRIVDDVKTLKSNIQSLQPKINGVQGQVVGFDNDGNAIATAETDPTVPEWAKQAQKPTYTAQEVGALPDTEKFSYQYLVTGGDSDVKWEDRPFYEYTTTEVLIDGETINGFDDISGNGSLYVGHFASNVTFTEGTSYIVTWDGTVYQCVCARQGGQFLYLGDINCMINGAFITYPFLIIAADGGFEVGTSSSADSHVISIATETRHINHLDSKFIKDMYYDKREKHTIVDNYSAASTDIPACNFVVGNTYDVIWNGTTYSGIVCQADGEFKYLYRDECPFRIDDGGGNSLYVESYDGSESFYTVSIIEYVGEFKQIDTKYIPQNVGSALKFNKIVLTDKINGYDYIVEMCNGNIVSHCVCIGISCSNPSIKQAYMAGDVIDPDNFGLVAVHADDSISEVESFTYEPHIIAEDTNKITITAIKDDKTYTIYVPVDVSAFDPATALIDFTYVDNGDGTYTITGWNETLNGVATTDMSIPNNTHVKI